MQFRLRQVVENFAVFLAEPPQPDDSAFESFHLFVLCPGNRSLLPCLIAASDAENNSDRQRHRLHPLTLLITAVKPSSRDFHVRVDFRQGSSQHAVLNDALLAVSFL
jgi:hypothetical protein